MKTETRQIQMDRWSVKSSRPFEEIVSALDAEIGHPDMKAFLPGVSPAEMKAIVERALGPSGFMEFLRLNPGDIMTRETKGSARSSA